MPHQFPNLTVIGHPLVRHKLAVLRDKETSKKKFKELQGVRSAKGRGTLAKKKASRKPKW